MSIQAEDKELSKNIVRFKNSKGVELTASLMKAGKQRAVFEHFAPYSEFAVGDAVDELAIEQQGEVIFQGKAQVSALVDMGGKVAYEADLDGQWVTPRHSRPDFLRNARARLEEHTEAWAKSRQVRDSFCTVVLDLETYLEGLQSWCQQVESEILLPGEGGLQEVLEKVGPVVSLEIASHFAEYEREVAKLTPEQRKPHREFLKRTLHRFILQSPFSERCFVKPLGYAGDYGMVELMLGNPFQGRTLFAKLLNNAFLETGPVQAHQNRIEYLVDKIREVVSQRSERGLRTRILNLGCGPADEIRRLIERDPCVTSCDFELLDFSDVTLRYTKKKIAESCREAGREVAVTFIEQSIQGFLKKAARGEDFAGESYDLVYCAGLFDYLSQPFCAKLTATFYDLVKPGGQVVVTNVSKHNTIPFVMEDFLEWEIIDRSEDEMMALVPGEKLRLLNDLKSDVTRINLFLELQKPVARSTNVGATEKIDAAETSGSRVPSEVRGGRSHRANSEL